MLMVYLLSTYTLSTTFAFNKKGPVMVNNSTNMNTTNNYLTPQIFEHKKTTTRDVGNTDPGLGHMVI